MNTFRVSQKDQLSRKIAESHHGENLVRAIGQIEQNAYSNIFDRCLLEKEAELQFQKATVETIENAERRERLIKEEKQRIEELKERQRQKVSDEKRRQQIRETNHELQELERKLRAAYVGKGLKNQLAEKEAIRLQEKLNLQKEQNHTRKLVAEDKKFQIKRKEQEKSSKLQLRDELQKQMDIKKYQNQILYKEFLKEKKQVDDIVQKIYDEQLAELEEKLTKRKQLASDLNEIKRARKLWREYEQREIEEENKRIAKYIQERDAKLEKEQAEANARKLQTNGLVDKMCAELEEIEKKAREREDLLLMLKVEEMQEQMEIHDRTEMERKFRLRLATRLQQDEQRQQNILLRLQNQQDDRQYRIDQLERLAEIDKIEQLTAEKRRQKIAEHHKCVREEIERRKKRRDQEIVELVQAQQDEHKEKEKLQQIIEEERIKLLKEHAAELIGFFPPGILRESDRAILKIP